MTITTSAIYTVTVTTGKGEIFTWTGEAAGVPEALYLAGWATAPERVGR